MTRRYGLWLAIGLCLAGQAEAQTPVKRQVALAPTGLEATEEGRNFLAYLLSCALEEGAEASLDVAGVTYRFPGGEGLAPAWADRAMTVTEQYYVSACLLARTNADGVKVPIYLIKGTAPEPDDLRQASGGQPYTLFEGMFFGNLFSDPPIAYACSGTAAQAAPLDGVFSRRRCVFPTSTKTPDGYDLSACGFIITGRCSDPGALTVGGRTWDEVIQVWLKPDRPAE